jgi:hypothetical protein
MRRHRSLLRVWRERHLSQKQRDAAEEVRREREDGRLRNRAEAMQAESRRDTWTSPGPGPG